MQNSKYQGHPNKLISVIIPVKNGENYLDSAIDRIQKQNMNSEIIVVDDASTDRTAEIAEKRGCLVLYHEICIGPVAGKNTGIAAASGEYILFHDADDVMRDGALRKLYEAMEEDPSASCVMAKVQDFHSPDLTEEEAKINTIQEEAYYGLFTGAVLIRKSVFDIIGKFDERLTSGEILAWKSKLDRHNMTIKKLDFISTDRRVHNSNYGRRKRTKKTQDYASVLRARIVER